MSDREHRGLRRAVTVGMALVCSALCSMGVPPRALAGSSGFDPEIEYRVTYQTGSNSAQTLERVKVGDIVDIGSRAFLVVYLSGYKTRAYVDFDSVRSILPATQ